VLVKDLMAAEPLHISPHRSVAEATEMMSEHNIRHLPVLDEDGRLLGLVTRSSLGKALPGMGTGLTQFESRYLTSSTRASDVMIRNPDVVSEDEAVEDVARVMNEKRISSLLVMSGEDLVGIITDTDIFEAMLELLGARRPGVRITAQIPHRPGELAKIAGAIAGVGGNISAVGGWHLSDEYWAAVVRVEDVSRDQVVGAVEGLPDVKVVDVRVEDVPRG
jgi:acetoin utilization protein AcuB